MEARNHYPAGQLKETNMTTELAQNQSNETMLLLRTLMPQGSTKEEMQLFSNVCERTKLDPFARQIYPMKRWDGIKKCEVLSFQISIDGFRVIAERNGNYAGQTGPHWCGDDGIWKDVWLSPAAPKAARVGVLRKDFKEPIYSVAKFDEYAQKTKDGRLVSMWEKMAANQIAKCAEALALRRAFPNDLSGLYTADEMAQATKATEEQETKTEPAAEQPKNSSAKLLAQISSPTKEVDREEEEAIEATFIPSAGPREPEKESQPTKEPKYVDSVSEEVRQKINEALAEDLISLTKPNKAHFIAILAIHGLTKKEMPEKAGIYMTHRFGKNKWDELDDNEKRMTMRDAVAGLLNEPVLL